MPLDEHGNEVTDGWEPGNAVLRGATQTPDDVNPGMARLDELPHRERWRRGLVANVPDPGYDPDADDLAYPL